MKLTDDMKRIVQEQMLGFVATVCPDGTPNLSPKGTTTVWDDEHLVFADLASPGTMRNLRTNPFVEINVVDPIVRRGYRFKGRAELVTEGPLFERAMAFYEGLMTRPRERARGFVIVTVEQARKLTSPAYGLGRTEPEVVEQWERHYARLGKRRRGDADDRT
jgi:uncharacterized protein